MQRGLELHDNANKTKVYQISLYWSRTFGPSERWCFLQFFNIRVGRRKRADEIAGVIIAPAQRRLASTHQTHRGHKALPSIPSLAWECLALTATAVHLVFVAVFSAKWLLPTVRPSMSMSMLHLYRQRQQRVIRVAIYTSIRNVAVVIQIYLCT